MTHSTIMDAQAIHSVARAQQDWCDGCCIDENPFPRGSREAAYWALEMDRLMIDEAERELSAV